MLLEELAAIKTELATARLENEQLIHGSGAKVVGSDVNFRPSEYLDDRSTSSGSGSMLTTMSNMSLGALNIPECKPSDGETDIDKKAYEHWKEILNASFNLVRAADERAKMDIFRIKAGSKLLEVMQGTSFTPNMPDDYPTPMLSRG